MKKSGKLVTLLLALLMVVVTVLPAMAAPSSVESKRIELIANMKWVFGAEVTYDGDRYAGGRALCETVYPPDGMDNYKYIRCRITEYYGTVISTAPYTILGEGAGYHSIEIKRAYDYLGHIYFQFSGNTKYPAYAIISCDGRGLPIVP